MSEFDSTDNTDCELNKDLIKEHESRNGTANRLLNTWNLKRKTASMVFCNILKQKIKICIPEVTLMRQLYKNLKR